MICIQGQADATAAPSSLASVKSRMVYLSGSGLPRLFWKNRCSSSSSSSSNSNLDLHLSFSALTLLVQLQERHRPITQPVPFIPKGSLLEKRRNRKQLTQMHVENAVKTEVWLAIIKFCYFNNI